MCSSDLTNFSKYHEESLVKFFTDKKFLQVESKPSVMKSLFQENIIPSCIHRHEICISSIDSLNNMFGSSSYRKTSDFFVIQHPFGKNMSPDLMIVNVVRDVIKIIPIEAKSRNIKSKNPNCGLNVNFNDTAPIGFNKQNWIYNVAIRNDTSHVKNVIFPGGEQLYKDNSDEFLKDYDEFIMEFEKVKQLGQKFSRKFSKKLNNEILFSPNIYIRQNFNGVINDADQFNDSCKKIVMRNIESFLE